MSDGHEDPPPVADTNPFAMVAVADATGFGSDTVTVMTPAIREAVGLVSDFLTAPVEHGRPAGNVIAIVGEYGTGKTHLLGTLLRHVEVQAGQGRTRAVYLEAEPRSFVELYRDFVEELDLDDVRARVREYYADVVADALSLTPFTAEIATHVRSGDLDPVETSASLGLAESRNLATLRSKLEQVTDNAAFGTALTLLLRPGFTHASWEWLTGHAPDGVLVDRGIDAAIQTEEAALEAMGVFALLYGHRNRRFIVVIDELNRLMSARRRPTEQAVAAFHKMLQVFASTNALLVLCGLPDYLDVLGDNFSQRIGRAITVSPLDAEATSELIRRSQERLGRPAELRPFDPDIVRYLVKLTEGNARRIVWLCHRLYRSALDEVPDPRRARVTEAMVRQVARGAQSAFDTVVNVRNEIRQVLSASGIEYVRDHALNDTAAARADYWIPVAGDEVGCAVVVSGAVLDQIESTALIDRATSILAAVERVDVLLVVVGPVHADLAGELADVFTVEPIEYNHWTFKDLMANVLGERMRVLQEGSTVDPLSIVRERVNRVSRQQANTQRMIDQLADTLERLNSTSDQQFARLHRDLVQLTGVTRSDEPSARVEPTPLPSPVAELFAEAQRSLASVDHVDTALRSVFVSSADDPAQVGALRGGVRARLRSQHVFQSVGVAAMLHKLLLTFREEVTDWYRTYASSSASGQPLPVEHERLKALCRAYDAVYEYIPVFRLEGLEEFTSVMPGGWSSASPAALNQVRSTFNELGRQVQSTVWQSVTGSR
ncbi:ATP-binding protein [Actinosynnema sp. NPDC051121]